MRATWMIGAVAFLAGCEDGMRPVSVDADGGSAVAAWEDAQGRRVEAFAWGGDARTPVADYLIVLDGSVSMRAVIGRVQDGFAALDPALFPAEARIGVMSTLPGKRDPSGPSGRARYELHHRVGQKSLTRHDPGFLQLVDRAGLLRVRERVPSSADRFTLSGCDAWFAPDANNEVGVPCIVAHTQTMLAVAHAEAGLTAFQQLLASRAGTPTFRPGAAANVIFVSDTHDPGVGSADPAQNSLLAGRPDAAALIAAVEVDNVVSSLRFHAIAPETECVERWLGFGPAYYDVAEATGGAILDLCTSTDYRPILERAFDEGARPTRPRFALGAVAEEVTEVRVDGQPTPWTLTGTGRVVELTGGLSVDPQAVEVEFTKQQARPRRPRAIRAPEPAATADPVVPRTVTRPPVATPPRAIPPVQPRAIRAP